MDELADEDVEPDVRFRRTVPMGNLWGQVPADDCSRAAVGSRPMTEYPTASAHGIVRHCIGAHLIPLRYPRTTAAAQDGHKAHEANLPALAGLAPFPDTPRGRWLRDRVGVIDGRIEVAIAMNPRTMEAIELGTGLERDYSGCPPGWIAMTLDHVALERPYLAELKTGGMDVPAPQENAQILTQAVGVQWLTGQYPEVRLIHARSSGGFWQWWRGYKDRWLTVGALYEWRAVLIGMMDAIDEHRDTAPEDLPLTPGIHCRFCDVGLDGSCPAKKDYMLSIGNDPIDEHERATVASTHAKNRLSSVQGVLADHPDVEVMIVHKRNLDTEAAIAAIPELAAYSARVVRMGKLDRYIWEHRLDGETRDAARERVEAELFDAGALKYTRQEKLIIPSNDFTSGNV